MSVDLNKFVERTGRLPSLPSVYYTLMRTIETPNASVEEVSAVITRDQSLATCLLKLANSAFYGLPARIGTVDEAVQLIGFREVQDLVLATSVIRAFDKLPADLVDVASFWKHSVACGIASALLAESQHDPVPERFFVGGLVHDIGHLIMFLNAPEESRQILDRCEREAQLCFRVEQEVLGFDHAMLGAELVFRWKLPHALVQMVRDHHNPLESRAAFLEAFLVHYADFIVSALELGNSGERFVAPLKVPANCEGFLLDEGRLESLVIELERRCDEIFPALTTNSR
jgi:putative nucleotidyltransferase with HDIG domain